MPIPGTPGLGFSVVPYIYVLLWDRHWRYLIPCYAMRFLLVYQTYGSAKTIQSPPAFTRCCINLFLMFAGYHS